MALAAFEADIPFPINADFSDGEKAITVGADIESINAGTYYLSKFMDFTGGLYVIKGIADTAGRWSIGFDASSGRILFANTALIGTQEATIYIAPGRQRVDVVLECLITPTGRSYIAFSLFKAGVLAYASSAVGWVFDTAPIPDVEVPALGDVRELFPVFTVLPNWAMGVSERLSWETEIFTSETDVEQRRSLRRFARRSIEAEFLRTEEQRARLDFFLAGVGKTECLVPLWFEQIILTAPFLASLAQFSLPAGEATLREFRIDDLVVIMGKSPDVYNLAKVADIVDDLVSLAMVGDGDDWPAGTRIMPLRTARVEDEASIENLTDGVGRTQIRFEFCEPDTQFVDGVEFEGNLFPWEPEWSAPVNSTYSRLDYLFDATYGRKLLTDIGQRARIGSKFHLRFYDRAGFNVFRLFLGRKRGRAQRFRMPTFMNDLKLRASIDGPSIQCRAAGFAKYMSIPHDARRYIYIEKKDGTHLIYGILGCVESSPGVETFTLDGYDEDISILQVKRIMFLMDVRFDQDSFEITHMVDNCKAIEIPLVTRSVEPTDWTFVWPIDDGGGGPIPPAPEG